MPSTVSRASSTLIAAWTLACGQDPATAQRENPAATASPSAALVPLNRFGIAAASPASRGCRAPEHRQFDFWVGSWDVFSGTTLAGTNVVESELGGCVVEENWNAAGGGRGRSLNIHDAATGKWSQMWVDGGGCPAGVIVIEGGLEEGSMVMTGRSEQPDGFQFGPPCAAPPPREVFSRINVIRWTLLETGSVIQQFAAAINGNPLPPLPAPSSGVGLRYDRVTAVTALPSTSPSFCSTRAAAREFDFMIGTWDVHQGDGRGAQGTATFSKDLNDCLVEERLAGPGGYEGWSFNAFNVFMQKWVRTYVDSDGQRLYMTGGLVDGRMVLVGARPGAGKRDVQVRITWDPADPARVVQLWEYSLDGGEQWRGKTEIVFTRR